MSSDPKPKPLNALILEAFQHLSALVRGEVELARAELAENMRAAVTGLVLLAVAAILFIAALNVLAAAAVAGLMALGVPLGWALAGVGTGIAVVALGLGFKGIGALRSFSIAPKRTMQSLHLTSRTLKGTKTDDETI